MWLINQLKTFYNFCGKYDTYSHRIGGGLLALQSMINYKWSYVFTLLLSLVISTLFFFGKEYIDTIKKNPTGWSWRDIVNGYKGWIVITIIILIIKLWLKNQSI